MASTAAILLLVGASLAPEATAATLGSSCENWARRRIELQQTREQARSDHREIVRTGAETPTLEEAAEHYRRTLRDEPGWHLHELSEWVRGRYAGCGIVDATTATTTARLSRHYALTLTYPQSRDGYPRTPQGPQ